MQIFESILVLEDNGKQNPKQSYTNKYQKHITWTYGYKLVCINDKFNLSFKISLHKDPVYNFTNNMMEENKYCNEVIKKSILIKNL